MAAEWGLVTAGARGEMPPMTMEKFDTPWNDGIMARHAGDGRPLGHLHWHPDGEIDMVSVHPDFRRMGVGTAMLDHARANPDIYRQAYRPIHHSDSLSKAGRAWANSDPTFSDPGDENITEESEDPNSWGWTAIKQHVPAHIPYTGQNEAEMKKYLRATPAQPYQPSFQTAAVDHLWPSWWDDKPHPSVPWDKRWNPNHPEHSPAPFM